MLRLTRLLVSAVPTLATPAHLKPALGFLPVRGSWFSTPQSKKVLDLIKRETSDSNIDRICIEMASLNNKVKEEAVKQVLEKIIKGEFSPAVIVHDKFNVHLKNYPEHYFEAYFFRIIESMSRLMVFIDKDEAKGKKVAANEINDCFTICFETLKKLNTKYATLKEIDLLKTFAHYHVNYLQQLVPQDRVELCLTKGREFYKKAITKIMDLLKEFEKKEKELSVPSNSSETIQEKVTRENAIS